MNQEYLYGINTILALLNVNAGKRKIFGLTINGSKNRSPRIDEIISMASSKGIPVKVLEHGDFIKYLSNAFSSEKVKASDCRQGVRYPGRLTDSRRVVSCLEKAYRQRRLKIWKLFFPSVKSL